jgi:hypothetical protein
LWEVTRCSVVDRYQRFGVTKLHGVTSKKTTIFIVIALRSSNLTCGIDFCPFLDHFQCVGSKGKKVGMC